MQTPQPGLHGSLPIYHHPPSRLFPITPQVLGSASYQRTNIEAAGVSNQPGQNPGSKLLPGKPSVPPVQQPTSISTPQGMYPMPTEFGGGTANQLPPHFAALPATGLFPGGPQQYGIKQPMFITPQPLPQQQPLLKQQAQSKQRNSRAIKIINPETRQEVSQQGLQQEQGVKSDHSVQRGFKEKVLGAMEFAPKNLTSYSHEGMQISISSSPAGICKYLEMNTCSGEMCM